MNQYIAYIVSLREHIENVQEACEQLGVDRNQADIHDQSKFSPEEFESYANYFWNSDGTPAKKEDHTTMKQYEFIHAWLHHIHYNPHHWQHWIFPDGYAPENMVASKYITRDGTMPMPERFVLEMVADWMGASKSYTGSWDMGIWLIENIKRITLHPYSTESLRRILSSLDSSYISIVNIHLFKHELKNDNG